MPFSDVGFWAEFNDSALFISLFAFRHDLSIRDSVSMFLDPCNLISRAELLSIHVNLIVVMPSAPSCFFDRHGGDLEPDKTFGN